MYGHQAHPIDFHSQTYPSLLDDVSVRFDAVNGDPNAPEWSNVLVNKDIRIVGFKEVRILLPISPHRLLIDILCRLVMGSIISLTV